MKITLDLLAAKAKKPKKGATSGDGKGASDTNQGEKAASGRAERSNKAAQKEA